MLHLCCTFFSYELAELFKHFCEDRFYRLLVVHLLTTETIVFLSSAQRHFLEEKGFFCPCMEQPNLNFCVKTCSSSALDLHTSPSTNHANNSSAFEVSTTEKNASVSAMDKEKDASVSVMDKEKDASVSVMDKEKDLSHEENDEMSACCYEDVIESDDEAHPNKSKRRRGRKGKSSNK